MLDIAGIINHDLQLFTNWNTQWCITFDTLKTEAILFTFHITLHIAKHLVVSLSGM